MIRRASMMAVVCLGLVFGAVGLAARGASPSAFDRRCIPPGCVAQRSNTGGILAFRALPAGRIVGLGATTDLHHGLLGAQTKGLTPELILGVAQVVDVQISPDGDRVLYQVSRQRGADEGPGVSKSELWMVPAVGGAPERFTNGNDRAARWSPDGASIAFLSQRSDLTQVHLIRPAGGEAQPLTSAPNNVGSFKWSPDGTRIAYTVTDPKTTEEKEAEAKGRDWTVADTKYKHTRLYVIDVASKASILVTNAVMTV